MPTIKNKDVFRACVSQGVTLVKGYQGGLTLDASELIADAIGISEQRFRKWRYASTVPDAIDDDQFIKFLWAVLVRGDVNRGWFATIYGATSLPPLPTPLTIQWLAAYFAPAKPTDAALQAVAQRIGLPEAEADAAASVLPARPRESPPPSALLPAEAPVPAPLPPLAPPRRWRRGLQRFMGLWVLVFLLGGSGDSSQRQPRLLFTAPLDAQHLLNLVPLNTLIEIPAGVYVQGSTRAEIEGYGRMCVDVDAGCDASWFEDELERHQVRLKGYAIQRFEVSNREFMAYRRQFPLALTAAEQQGWSYVWESPSQAFTKTLGATWLQPLGPGSSIADHLDDPVVHITPDDAAAYCAAYDMRLPTEAEWEQAARGPAALPYPWGATWDPARVNYARGKVSPGLLPVQSLPEGRSPYGLWHMLGNVAEFTADFYDAEIYPDDPAIVVDNPTGPATPTTHHTRRGGSINSMAGMTHTTWRIDFELKDAPSSGTGFRCVKDVP